MNQTNYEERYFKLKKSNDELLSLLNKVMNDLKQSKLEFIAEKQKNIELSVKNENLSLQLNQIIIKTEESDKTIHDLSKELEYLRTYSKAIEGVAENYCGQNITTQHKYKELKRQSSIFFSKFADAPDILDIDIDCIDSPSICETPTPVFEIENIKKNHDKIMENEKIRYENLRQENNEAKNEICKLQSQVNELKEKIKTKEDETSNLNDELEILITSYHKLQEDHEKLFSLFAPYLQLKAENKDLKRTSALLLNNITDDDRLMEFFKITDELKAEIVVKDKKILELEMKHEENEITRLKIELTAVKSELNELSESIAVLTKERDTLKHENRILLEQKVSYGVPPPPPPPPNAPPPIPIQNKSKLLSIFKNKKEKTLLPKSPNKDRQEDQVLSDLMNELERKLLEKVKAKLKNENQPPKSPSAQKTIDHNDTCSSPMTFIKLRSQSVPSIVIEENSKNELRQKFEKFKVLAVDENT